jgi:hypothetical protein
MSTKDSGATTAAISCECHLPDSQFLQLDSSALLQGQHSGTFKKLEEDQTTK